MKARKIREDWYQRTVKALGRHAEELIASYNKRNGVDIEEVARERKVLGNYNILKEFAEVSTFRGALISVFFTFMLFGWTFSLVFAGNIADNEVLMAENFQVLNLAASLAVVLFRKVAGRRWHYEDGMRAGLDRILDKFSFEAQKMLWILEGKEGESAAKILEQEIRNQSLDIVASEKSLGKQGSNDWKSHEMRRRLKETVAVAVNFGFVNGDLGPYFAWAEQAWTARAAMGEFMTDFQI